MRTSCFTEVVRSLKTISKHSFLLPSTVRFFNFAISRNLFYNFQILVLIGRHLLFSSISSGVKFIVGQFTVTRALSLPQSSSLLLSVRKYGNFPHIRRRRNDGRHPCRRHPYIVCKGVFHFTMVQKSKIPRDSYFFGLRHLKTR